MTKASEQIIKLNDFSHTRKRTDMYFGSRDPHSQIILTYDQGSADLAEVTWTPAAFTMFREILDNALDEVVGHGFGDRIDVTYDVANQTFSVADNGRGIPLTYSEEHGMHMATLALSSARAGRNFEVRGQVAGTNGIGASGVNFCSEFFILEVERDGQCFKQSFSEGEHDLIVGAVDLKKSAGKTTGTKVTFKISEKVFKEVILSEQFLKDRIYEIAICNPKVKVYYNGEKIVAKSVEKNLFAGYKPITIEVREGTFQSDFWLIPEFFESGEHQHSLVNNIPAFDGGVHIDAFKRSFFSGLLTALEKESKKRKLQPNRSDLAEGLMIFNITRMEAPNFNSQSKTRLNNEETAKHVKATLDDPEFFKGIIKKYGDWINGIYERCASRTMKKDASEVDKEAKKMLREKVPGLMDATGKDRSKCILFLAEGLSAIAGMASVRDPEVHGGIGLKGKVMNVTGVSPKDVINDGALRDIMNSIGISPSGKWDRDAMRYGKVFIAADADPDGLNITALLVNFFHTFWPEMFDDKDNPIINVFMTPFIIAEKGKQRKYWYANNYEEFAPEDYKGWTITRAKGLGTLTKEDWAHSLANPVTFPITQDGNMAEALSLVFHKTRADDRKNWIGL